MIVAQISDLHVRRRGHVIHHMANTASYLKRTIETINGFAIRPDVVVATGDLAESGRPEEYVRLRELLGHLHVPYLLMPGNHDDREALRAAFPAHRYLRKYASHASYCYEGDDARLIALDSTNPDLVGGYLNHERLAWLDAKLAERDDVPAIVALHHPPFKTGVAVFDRQRFEGAGPFADIIAQYPNVRRIVAGHIHTALLRPFARTVACTAPSTSPQFVIGRARLGIGIENAGFLLHEVAGNAAATHVVRLNGDDPSELSA